MLVKVCGITEKTDFSNLYGKSDMLGFIFHNPSPRNAISVDKDLIRDIGKEVETVGVFVDYPVNALEEICRERKIKTLQLHGEESPEYCLLFKERGYKVIKAIRIREHMTSQELNEKIRPYDFIVDRFLFDTGGKHAGGNGKKFDWEILKSYKGFTPYLLSGGIGPEDVDLIKDLEASSSQGFIGIDLNSRFEISPGKKNTQLLNEFIDKIKRSEPN